MTVRHLLVAAAPGDATTASAFETRDAAAAVTGERGEVYARFIDPALADDVLPLEALTSTAPLADDVLVFHASIGDPVVYDVVAARTDRLVVVYHNVSPASAFARWDPTFAPLLAEGRAQIAALASRCTVAITPSEFNAHDLRSWNFRDVRVVPLVIDVARRLGAAGGDPPEGSPASAAGDPLLLFVGQLQPHKRPELLVEMAHILATYSLPDAHLVLAGAHRLPAFVSTVKAFAHDLRAPVTFTGAVDDAEIGRLYRRADVFVTASDHEGFCAPVLEAMAFGVPVVARACGAIREVAGDAAVLIPAGEGPVVFAEAVATVARDHAVRAELVERGRRRAVAFAPDVLRRRLADAMAEVLA
ncbi:MAG TPA: glycosyltransferase [Acidimicrobiales bacterium]|nr:glycosyltransferase [Acidimicrobiales bacterium]